MSEQEKGTTGVKREFKGEVIFYKKRDGFGFVVEDGVEKGKNDIFVHWSDLPEGIKRLKPEQKIEYNVVDYNERFKAVDIKVIE